jgi:hypothetical protein
LLVSAFLHRGNGFLDRHPVLACWSLLRLGTNKAIGEDRSDEFKRFFSLGLCPQQAAHHLTLASPLAVPMWLWATDILPDLFPGRPGGAFTKLVQMRPQEVERLVDH